MSVKTLCFKVRLASLKVSSPREPVSGWAEIQAPSCPGPCPCLY